MTTRTHSNHHGLAVPNIIDYLRRALRQITGMGEVIAEGRRMHLLYGATIRTPQNQRRAGQPGNQEIVDDLRTQLAAWERGSI